MSRTFEETPTTSSAINNGEWIEVQPLVFQRPCIGQEHSASYNQNIAEGHTELSMSCSFSVNLSLEQLATNCKRAWYHIRRLHPVIAIELSTDLCIPQMMTYHHLTDPASSEAQEWMDETLQIVTNRSYRDVIAMTYNQRLRTRGKRSIMWLILDTRADVPDSQRSHGIVWNVSHALTDCNSTTVFLGHFFEMVVKGVEVDEIKWDDAASIIDLLPRNPTSVYEKQYIPTPAQKKQALIEAKDQVRLYADKMNQSVAMYPEPNYQYREHGTDCLMEVWTKRTSDALLRSLKGYNVGVTYAGAAATIMAAYELYGKGHEKGALIGMTRNAKRWIATIAVDTGRVTVPLGSDVVYLWIPFAKLTKVDQFNRRELLLTIAREIKMQLCKHLQDPHYLSTVPYMSQAFTEQLLSQKTMDDAADEYGPRHGEESANQVSASAPGFSSQGIVSLGQRFTHNDTLLTRHDFTQAGRQVGSSPWVGMYSLDGCLRFTLGYDCKYYNRPMMTKFMHLLQEDMASVIDCISTSDL